MKRDLEFIRELLLKIESGQRMFKTTSDEVADMLGTGSQVGLSQEEATKLVGHLELLEQAGLIEIQLRSLGGVLLVKSLTWQGHEFLDSVRDPGVWSRTKDGATAAGGWTLELVKELGKGFLKKQIEDRTGVKL